MVALPTNGTGQYTLTAFTAPTFVGGGSALLNPDIKMALGVTFGAQALFGFDGRVSGDFNGSPSSFSFTTPGGSAAPSLTNSFSYGGSLGLFGSAPVTASTGNLCSPLSACSVAANFIAGGANAETFAVAWGLVATALNKSILHGAGILTQAGAGGVTALRTSRSQAPSGSGLAQLSYGYPRGETSTGSTITLDSSGELDSVQHSSGAITRRGTSKNYESGSIDGILGWTRWAGGTGENSPATPASGGSPIIWGVPTVTRPTTGSATYALVGKTAIVAVLNESDIAPGTLKSGSLAINFGTSRVGIELLANFNDTDFALSTAGGVAAPSLFVTDRFSGAGTAVGGSCTACNASFLGFLAGPAASHVGLTYSFVAKPDSSLSATGVAAFKH